jgi:HAD superfamily hydrolase (TIGR01509 family)
MTRIIIFGAGVLMAIRAVIFDLGRVLVALDFSRALRRYPQCDLAAVVKFSTADDAQFTAYNRGDISPRQFHFYLTQKFSLPLSFADFRTVWTDIFSPMPGMRELVAELRRKYKLGLLSDTDPLHWAYLRRKFAWLREAFPAPTLSFRERLTKPAPELFRRAAQAVNEPPSRCLFIDDRADNVAGAASVGMSAVQFSGAANLRCELARILDSGAG